MPSLLDTKKTEDLEQSQKEKVDVLGRQEFVDQLISVAETLVANKKNACYAINGEWGVGKTFVLEAFEEQLRQYGQPDTTLSKYLVFHYNCWQYDYYNEPLIAIVASLLDQIDEQVNLLSENQKEPIKVALKRIGAGALKAAGVIVEKKFGVDPNDIVNIATGISKEANDNLNAVHEYDSYFDFKKTLSDLSDTIKKLSSDQTIIFVVDELDRCLPEYTIKILERLHHIFADIPNVQVVLAMDRSQLEKAIMRIYGEKFNASKYLEKFINFELKLSTAKVVNIIDELYPDYMDSFKLEYTEKDEINQTCQILLGGLDIRKAKAIVEKSQLCHKLLNADTEEQDRVVLCLEVFLTLLHSYNLNIDKAKELFGFSDPLNSSDILSQYVFAENVSSWIGLPKMSSIYREGTGRQLYFDNRHQGDIYIFTGNVLGVLLGCYRVILDFGNDLWLGKSPKGSCLGEIYPEKYLKSYTKKFWQFIQLIE